MIRPDVYIFNPTCEMAIANGTVAWQPSRFLRQFEIDLELLPMFTATESDWVIVEQLPSRDFIEKLNGEGFSIPSFILDRELKKGDVRKISKGALKPWGWSPALYHKFKSWQKSWGGQFKQSPMLEWHDSVKELYSRETALQVLRGVGEELGWSKEKRYPKACHNIEELVQIHKENGQSMIKAPWSSSGRGVQPVVAEAIDRQILKWSSSVLKQQGKIMIEPLLDRVLDFAFQFKYEKGKASYLGTSWFFTDENGKYQGNWLKRPEQHLDSDVLNLIDFQETKIVNALKKHLELRFSDNYEGYLGVDAMVYRTGSGKLEIQPCMEINVRMNMGILAMELEKVVGENYDAMRVVNRQQEEKESETTRLESRGIIRKRFPLTEVLENTLFYAELVKF
ncbi:hypothetical protein EMN47_09170 [Prolixibacteraceae bacterium JC049]|nr:hypothetical protein [Prolixibacteraceae bacterium JC049]